MEFREKMAWVCIRSTLDIAVKARWPCHRFVFRVNSVAAHSVRRVRIKSWVSVSLGDISHRHVITENQMFCLLGQSKESGYMIHFLKSLENVLFTIVMSWECILISNGISSSVKHAKTILYYFWEFDYLFQEIYNCWLITRPHLV